jgi:hypothetical protein
MVGQHLRCDEAEDRFCLVMFLQAHSYTNITLGYLEQTVLHQRVVRLGGEGPASRSMFSEIFRIDGHTMSCSYLKEAPTRGDVRGLPI